MWSSRPYTFDRVVRIFFTMIVACIVLYFAYILRHVLLPFIVACLVAYLIEPWVKWNQRLLHIKKHLWGVLLTILEVIIILGVVGLILTPIIGNEFSQLGVILDHYVKNGHTFFSGFMLNIHEFLNSHLDMDKIMEEFQRLNVSNLVEEIWRSLTGGLDKILGMLGWLISIVYVVFILLDFDKYEQSVKQYIPDKYKGPVAEIVQDTSWTMKKYFRNQALISLIVGICYSVGFSIVGIPMAVVIGLTNIILFMIPYMVYISLIPVTLMCIFKSMDSGVDFWIIWFECIAVYVFVEAFSDLFLTPKIMGKALGLNPALILLALSVWGSLLGILGMVIALPATTILMKWFKIWLTGWRNKINASTISKSPPGLPVDTSVPPDNSNSGMPA